MMDVAGQPAIGAKQELDHRLILSREIDYLGKMRLLFASRYTPRKIGKRSPLRSRE